MKNVEIDGREVGENAPVFIIAEAGLNHNGSVDLAKKLIDIAAVSGADCVKFQKRTVGQLAIASVLDAKDDRFPEFGSTYREIREHLELSLEAHLELKEYAEARKLIFLSTPFDNEAVDFLDKVGVCAYKIASHSLTNLPFLSYVASRNKPVFLSTGMATMQEIDAAVEILTKAGTPLVLNHCVSLYPQPPQESRLGLMKILKTRFDLPVGYSGHELGNIITFAAVALGAAAVERHYTASKSLPGFDHKMSLEPDELIQLCRGIRDIEKALPAGNKDVLEQEWITRKKYHVSLVTKAPIIKGTKITEEMLTTKNPGTGIPPSRIQEVLGKTASRDIPQEVLITEEMLRIGL